MGADQFDVKPYNIMSVFLNESFTVGAPKVCRTKVIIEEMIGG